MVREVAKDVSYSSVSLMVHESYEASLFQIFTSYIVLILF